MAMSILFTYCYFGRIATDSYANMSDCVYFDMHWQKLLPKQQAHIVLMIRTLQKPIHYHGFGVVIMNLNTFTLVSDRKLKDHHQMDINRVVFYPNRKIDRVRVHAHDWKILSIVYSIHAPLLEQLNLKQTH